MAYREYSFGGFHLTPWVKRLIIANTAIFILTAIAPIVRVYLAFEPAATILRPWTVFTYMFVHGGFFHLLFNMLALFFFGPPLEERWGSREFVKFYLICGLGGAALSFVFAFNHPVVGASAAVYGVMLAFAMVWPDVPIYLFAIFPIKAKWLVAIFVGMSILSALPGGASDGIAHFAHLGGFAAAYLYMKFDPKIGAPFRNLRRMVSRPKLTVVPGGKPPRPSKPQERPRRRADERTYDEIDRVLDKISTHGMASLTPEERKLLDDVSRRYRQN